MTSIPSTGSPLAGDRRTPDFGPLEPEDPALLRYPVSVFGPEHGLTPAQVWLAQACLTRKRDRLTGKRYAARRAGIVSAVKRGLVGNSAWGRRMLATRAGRARARLAPFLSDLAPLGARAAAVARRRRAASEGSRPR